MAVDKALFIDIDDTLTMGTGPAPDVTPIRGQAMLGLMAEFAEKLGLRDRELAKKEIERIYDEVRWWHWSDFICALDLPACNFWDYALERESRWLGPVEPNLRKRLSTLHDAGFLLFITSNNPSSGIVHKLRIAKIADSIAGSPLFYQYFSPCDLRAMKENPVFWKKCLANTGIDPSKITVIGDNPKDDVSTPNQAGISNTILYDRHDLHGDSPAIWKTRCTSWDAIVEHLLLPEMTNA